jgi:hypothetical protein
MPETAALEADHVPLADGLAARRYFRQFDAILGRLAPVAAAMRAEASLAEAELRILGDYMRALDATFHALSLKYLLTGSDAGQGFGAMQIDRVESGFPVFSELLLMANDAQQAARHLEGMAAAKDLKEQMLRQILSDLTVPTRLQFALSQRLYYQALVENRLYWASNDPVCEWAGGDRLERRRFLLHWAVYDSQVNLPTIYLMEVEDTGDWALSKDTRRWPEAQRHLIAQSVAGLKLLTIAQGFDRDFDDLHPKRLRRFHIGPMYSSAFTLQSGPLKQVLDEVAGTPEQDWALAWAVETLESERVELQKSGWFGRVEREIFALDPFSGRGVDTGATRTERAIILPARPYQVLAERNPPGFHEVRKFVVSPKGRVLSYR